MMFWSELGVNSEQEQIEQLTVDLKLFTELKRRVKESTLKRDLQRNIQVHFMPINVISPINCT